MGLIAPIFAAASSIAGGLSQASALKTEAKQLERVRNDEKIKAKQISASRLEQRNEALATIDAVRSSRGLSVDSPGGVNIRRSTRQRADENLGAELLSSQNRQETLKTQAALKRRAAPFAILSGVNSAGNSLAKSIG